MMTSLPSDFPYRIYTVPGWVTPVKVPRYITRVDVDEPGMAGTHGWQVRYRRKELGSKFFSDVSGRNRRAPRASLLEATEYLASIYTGPVVQLKAEPTRRRRPSIIHEAGIRLVREKNRRGFIEIRIEAMSPRRQWPPKRFYVGTEKTITPERLEAGIKKARLARKRMVKEHLANPGYY